MPFKFTSLFSRSKKRIENDPWLEAFLELTKAAERIVAKKDATEEDWKKAWNDAFDVLKGKIAPNDDEEEKETFSEFLVFVSKVSIRQGWIPPSREEVTYKLEELGGANMKFEINSIYDLGVLEGKREGKQEGEQAGVRNMLEQCIALRFPQIARSTMNALLSITDVELLKSIFKVACTADSLDNFQRDIRGIAPAN